MARSDLIAFALLFSLLSALLSNYYFGTGDHVDHLSIQYRLADPGFLAQDTLVELNQGFNPRFYYTRLIHLSNGLMPVHAAYAILYLLTHAAIILITALATRDLTGSPLAACLAATTCGSGLTLFTICGYGARVTESLIISRYLALPFTLYGLWQGMAGRTIAWSFIPAILLHPTQGIMGALLSLAASAVHGKPLRLAPGLLTLAAATIFGWLLPRHLTGDDFRLSDGDFLRIFAYERNSHHLLPSRQPLIQYLSAACFTAATALSLAKFKQKLVRRAASTALGCLALGFLIQYVFVEIVPSRAVATLIPWRMLNHFAWIGWIFLAWNIATMLQASRSQGLFCLGALVTAPSLAVAVFQEWLDKPRAFSLQAAMAPALVLALLTVNTGRINTFILLAAGLAATLAITKGCRKTGLAALTACVCLVLGLYTLDRLSYLLPGPLARWTVMNRPILDLTDSRRRDAHKDETRLAEAARRLTDRNAVFLIPAGWENFRLYAGRATVTDFKYFPTTDRGMHEWHRRNQMVYVRHRYPFHVSAAGFDTLRQTYAFDYAVLPAGYAGRPYFNTFRILYEGAATILVDCRTERKRR